MVGLLAILKAGAAYLPVDLTSPQRRSAFMFTDAGVQLVLCDATGRAAVPAGAWAVLDLDEERAAVDAADPAPVPSGATPDDLAYIIYTSGSTGQPKGVAVPHRNVTRLLTATRAWFSFGERDVWTLFHSYAFDFSVWELWGALAHGGRLVVVPYLTSRSPADFLALLRRERVTVLNQTPSAFRTLVAADEEAGAGDLALRVVVFGGEAVDLTSVARWWQRHDPTAPQLVNMYGITETTVHVTYQPLRPEESAGRGNPIGVPIPDLAVYVVDRSGRLAPPGVPGELYVGGAGLARGYLDRPGLTADRFVPDGFGGRPGARLYRSGDLGRRTADGGLEYLGRNDDQVKVRGFRIETGEIEAALTRHPAVRGAVVVAPADADGRRRLVAYLAADGRPTTDELRQHLAGFLPPYQVPATFVLLDELPMTANGKIDHKALPDPGSDRPDLGHRYVEPRTDTERVLAEVWADVLGVDQVGASDSFFDLGGDSIRSVQVIGRARSRGVGITLQDLFRLPTVAGWPPSPRSPRTGRQPGSASRSR